MIRSRLFAATGMLFIGLSGCASAPNAPGLATNGEVVAYVTQNWDGYSSRAAYLAGRPRATNTLLKVSDVKCLPAEDHIACTFTTKVRFSDGVEAAPTVESIFGREPDGSIAQLIQVVHSPG
ncbi:MAG: hypothetical protein JWR59_1964 [Brevundimonas sp.]|nr:hypothetical protein [Brevundimonas sp.]